MMPETLDRHDGKIILPSRTEPFTHDSANEFIEDYFPVILGIVIQACKKVHFPEFGRYINSDGAGDALERIAKGLVRYDPGKNMSVSSWIYMLAYRAIQDGLRDRDPVSRVTRRTLKENMSSSGNYDGPFSNPTFHATHPPLSWEDLQEEYPEETAALSDGATNSIEEQFDTDSKWSAIQRFLTSDEYSVREKEIVRLRLSGLTEKQIGKKFGVSESRACQISKKIAGKLKALTEEVG